MALGPAGPRRPGLLAAPSLRVVPPPLAWVAVIVGSRTAFLPVPALCGTPAWRHLLLLLLLVVLALLLLLLLLRCSGARGHVAFRSARRLVVPLTCRRRLCSPRRARVSRSWRVRLVTPSPSLSLSSVPPLPDRPAARMRTAVSLASLTLMLLLRPDALVVGVRTLLLSPVLLVPVAVASSVVGAPCSRGCCVLVLRRLRSARAESLVRVLLACGSLRSVVAAGRGPSARRRGAVNRL